MPDLGVIAERKLYMKWERQCDIKRSLPDPSSARGWQEPVPKPPEQSFTPKLQTLRWECSVPGRSK